MHTVSYTHLDVYKRQDPEAEKNAEATSEQFDVSDQRTLDEVVNWLMKMDYIPSFLSLIHIFSMQAFTRSSENFPEPRMKREVNS